MGFQELVIAPPEWRRADSNRQPPACKAGALPIELRPHFPRGRMPPFSISLQPYNPPLPPTDCVDRLAANTKYAQ